MSVQVWVYFWVLYSVLLVNVWTLTLIPFCIDYYELIVSFDIWWHIPFNFVSSLRFFGYLEGFFFSPTESEPNVFYWITVYISFTDELLRITMSCCVSLEILYIQKYDC